MPIILWTNYFLEAQGYSHQDTILYQDNQSAILLEKNSRKSSSKRTKHLNCRFYFITDRINSDELSVEYCPTEEMVVCQYQSQTFLIIKVILFQLNFASLCAKRTVPLYIYRTTVSQQYWLLVFPDNRTFDNKIFILRGAGGGYTFHPQ
jgi:hypothetical protein